MLNVKIMNIVIQRTSKTPSYIAGKLYIDRCYFCDTVEHTASALPAGEYRIIRHHCHQYARHMPLIVPIEPGSNVLLYPSAPQHRRQEQEAGWRLNATRCQHCPSVEVIGLNTLMPCCCPMLKPGNGAQKRPDGSIVMGSLTAMGCMLHPQLPFDRLRERLRKLSVRGSFTLLTIADPP